MSHHEVSTHCAIHTAPSAIVTVSGGWRLTVGIFKNSKIQIQIQKITKKFSCDLWVPKMFLAANLNSIWIFVTHMEALVGGRVYFQSGLFFHYASRVKGHLVSQVMQSLSRVFASQPPHTPARVDLGLWFRSQPAQPGSLWTIFSKKIFGEKISHILLFSL